MTIGEGIEFDAVFETGLVVRSRGTITDIRDGSWWVFVLGYRWPFEIREPHRGLVGFYPQTTTPTEKPE